MIYRGTIDYIVGLKVYVKIPRYAGGLTVGPLDHPGFTLAPGHKVLIGQVGNVRDNLAILTVVKNPDAFPKNEQVLFFDDLASLPVEGESGKLYITEDDDQIYRWEGAEYARLAPPIGALAEIADAAEGAVDLDMLIKVAGTWVSHTPAEIKSDLDLETGIDLQAWSAVLDEYATINPTVLAAMLLVSADEATMQAVLDLVPGVDVQAYSAKLAALAAQTWSADQLTYQTGAGAVANAALTAFARTILDDVDQAAVRATLALTPGTNVQAWAANLDEYAGINPTTLAGTILVAATGADVRALIGAVIGSDVQGYDPDLAGLGGLTGNDVMPYRSGIGVWTTTAITTLARTILGRATAALMRSDLQAKWNGTSAATIGGSTLTADLTDRPSVISYLSSWAGNRTIDVSNVGNMVEGDEVLMSMKDVGTSRTLTFSAQFVAPTGLTFPAATTAGKKMFARFAWDDTDNVLTLLSPFVIRA